MGRLFKNNWVRFGLAGGSLPVVGAGVSFMNGADTIASAFQWADVIYRSIATPWGGVIFLAFCAGAILYGSRQVAEAEKDASLIRRQVEAETFSNFDKTIKFYGEFHALILAERHIGSADKVLQALKQLIDHLESDGVKPWTANRGHTEVGSRLREIVVELKAASSFLGNDFSDGGPREPKPVLSQGSDAGAMHGVAGCMTYEFDPIANGPFFVEQRANLKEFEEAISALRAKASGAREQLEGTDIFRWRKGHGRL